MKLLDFHLQWPEDMAQAVTTLAQTRGQSVADYIRQAIQRQLIWDGVHMEESAWQQAIQQGTHKVSIAANFAAIDSHAIMILLREWRKTDIQKTEGLPEDLARQKVQGDMDEALALAVTVFEDPRVQQRYAWVTRSESPEDLPDWLTDAVLIDDDPAEA